jgi:hypothetical protein
VLAPLVQAPHQRGNRLRLISRRLEGAYQLKRHVISSNTARSG